MNKAETLERLQKREPLFTVQPRVEKRRIMGTENEYGVDQDKSGEPIINESRLPTTFLNGGQAYVDCKHVEYCSPETSNAVSAVIYHEAGKSICHRCGYSPKLYCTNNDWYGKTHGAHENYFTCAPRDTWFKLVPFLVCRTVFIGSGWYTTANTLDWVTKLDMLTMFRENNPGDINDWLRSQDLQYYDLDPKEGLYYFLKDRKMVARLITDRLIEEGISHPPMDTRAYIRGKAVDSLLKKKRLCLTPRLWNIIRIFDAGDLIYEQKIVDPLKTYAELLPRIQTLRG